MYGYIDPFYVQASVSNDAGHIWNDQPIYLPPGHGLKLTRVNPQDDRDLDFEICGRTAETLDHPPLHSLKPASTEALVVSKAKRDRPVIVLGGGAASNVTPGVAPPTHLDIVWAVPVYGGDQYTEALRRRIQVYDVENYFYLPEDRELDFDEGFARLDHAQALRRTSLGTHRGVRLRMMPLIAAGEPRLARNTVSMATYCGVLLLWRAVASAANRGTTAHRSQLRPGAACRGPSGSLTTRSWPGGG